MEEGLFIYGVVSEKVRRIHVGHIEWYDRYFRLGRNIMENVTVV